MSVQTTPEADAEEVPTADVDAESLSLSKDDAFHLLQNARRRAVLRYVLSASDEQFTMRNLAEEVAAWENDTTVRQLSSDERQRVYIGLYQSHLPKLADHDIIDYDQSRGTIELRSRVRLLEPYLDVEAGLEADDHLSPDGPRSSQQEESDEDSGLSGVLSRFR